MLDKVNYKEHDGKLYRVVELYAGCNLECAVFYLFAYRDMGILACLDFNGHTFYSDKVNVNSAYREMTGMTKREYDNKEFEERLEYIRKEEEHKARIPELSKEWIEKGHKILNEKYWDYWDEIVPIRLSDLYKGMELGYCLDIVENLNNGCSLEEAKNIIDNQGHSYMSYGLVMVMVKEFCDRGLEFANCLDYE